ncbi:HAD family hydrolase [Phocaeicola vulgatus]|uniref:HAD family hydrolase n=1 Tax=Phocaeicola vulgatus TaxID=821 RepID=UPI00295002D5|nr:HAD hydrolase-like protein [Phocaeicola vulgatus]
MALVTGKGEKSCAITLRQFNMDTCFDKVKTGNPFKNNKAENFRELLADYKLQPDEMIYIGDTVSDIVSCREVGIRCLSASWITSCLDAQKLEAHNAGNVFYSIASLECYLMG